MRFKNQYEMNPYANHSTATATIATTSAAAETNPITTTTATATTTAATENCTTSADSGVVIIDNKTIFSKKCNNNHDNIDNNANGEINKEQLNNKRYNNNSNSNSNYNNNINNRTNDNKINIENIVNIEKKSNNIDQQKNNENKWLDGDSSRHCSPTVSARSTTISIASIDENAIDSSVVDSDSECEADAEGVHSNYIVKKLGQQTVYAPDSPNLPSINKGLKVVSQKISPGGAGPLAENILNDNTGTPAALRGALAPTTPQIGSIALTNSTDVTFGDKHFYEGPVTIQQFLIDSRDKWKQEHPENNGRDNPAFADDGSTKHGDCETANGSSSPPQNHPYKFIFNRKAVIITGTVIALVILIGILIVVTSTLFKSSIRKSKLLGDGDDSRKNIPINSTIGRDNFGGGNVLRIVPRDGWLAQPPSSELLTLNHPISRVIVIPTQTDFCDTQAACTFRVRFIQTFNIESLQNDDIIYNFLIGGDGNVYEGRGWEYKGAHLKGFNDDSVSFAYIGAFQKTKPDPKQMNVTKLLLQDGINSGKLSQNYKIYSANDLDPTATVTVGAQLYESFETWPNFSKAKQT